MCAYCDGNWVDNMDDYKSTLDYVFILGNDAINWNNNKQTSIVMSSTKVEYMAISQATRQAMWFSSLFENINVPQMKPILRHHNNQSCIFLLKNLLFHDRMKRIEIHHLVQKSIEKGFVKLVYYNLENMVVNILTKGLSVDKHEYFQHLMGVIKCIT
jgi:hypothetical protein